jgi:hypothetical protein
VRVRCEEREAQQAARWAKYEARARQLPAGEKLKKLCRKARPSPLACMPLVFRHSRRNILRLSMHHQQRYAEDPVLLLPRQLSSTSALAIYMPAPAVSGLGWGPVPTIPVSWCPRYPGHLLRTLSWCLPVAPQGIPAQHRVWAWPQLCGARERQRQHMAGYYAAMVDRGESASEFAHQIELVGCPFNTLK